MWGENVRRAWRNGWKDWPSPCSSVYWKACTNRSVSSTDRPTYAHETTCTHTPTHTRRNNSKAVRSCRVLRQTGLQGNVLETIYTHWQVIHGDLTQDSILVNEKETSEKENIHMNTTKMLWLSLSLSLSLSPSLSLSLSISLSLLNLLTLVILLHPLEGLHNPWKSVW